MTLPADTAAYVILEAHDDIGILNEGAPLDPSDERTGIKAINRIMAGFAADEAELGFTVLTKGTDLVTINPGAMGALIALLALALWPKYRTPEPTSVIVGAARRGETKMYDLGITILPSSHPCTLPTGSGNYNDGDGNNYTFYPCTEEEETTSIWDALVDDEWDTLAANAWDEV